MKSPRLRVSCSSDAGDGIRWAVRTGPSGIHGRGVFADIEIPRRRLLGIVTGVLRPLPAARLAQQRRRIIQLVEISRRWALDCSAGNALGLLNHCCDPNCRLRIADRRVEVHTRRAIAAGEELTVDYRETQHQGGMVCRCGRAGCRQRL